MILCEECNRNPATVYKTIMVDGKRKNKRLCAVCASLHGEVFRFSGSSINSILSGMFCVQPEQEERDMHRCSMCSRSLKQIKMSGEMGCSACYIEFASELEPVLNRMQGKAVHKGGIPKAMSEEYLRNQEIKELRKELMQAIKIEDYENAAKIRDSIRELTDADRQV